MPAAGIVVVATKVSFKHRFDHLYLRYYQTPGDATEAQFRNLDEAAFLTMAA